MSLKGLAAKWENDSTIRNIVLHRGTLLQWAKPTLTGVHTFETLAYNEKVITEVLQLWLPQNATPKTLIIDDIRAEANVQKVCLWFSFWTVTLNLWGWVRMLKNTLQKHA